MQEFMKLREQMLKEGSRLPSLKAFIALTGEYEERVVEDPNGLVYYELYAPSGIVLTYIHDSVTGEVTSIQLWDCEEIYFEEE